MNEEGAQLSSTQTSRDHFSLAQTLSHPVIFWQKKTQLRFGLKSSLFWPKHNFHLDKNPFFFFLPKFTLYFDQNPDYILTNIVKNSLYFDHFRNSYELLHRLPKSSPIAEMCMDTASYQQILFLICTGSHNLSELSSPSIRCSFIGLKQRKWKWVKARHVSHVMKDCFWNHFFHGLLMKRR